MKNEEMCENVVTFFILMCIESGKRLLLRGLFNVN